MSSGDPVGTAVVKARLQDKCTNVLLDTGAGRSLVDMGTVEEIGLSSHIKPFPPTRTNLTNASGDVMDMAGVVSISVQIGGKTVKHDFEVLNSKTFSTVLLGRDVLSKFGHVTFDFMSNRVKLGQKWVKGVGVRDSEKVRLAEETVVPARSEQVVTVRCKNNYFMCDASFEPKSLPGNRSIFISKARVVPNIHGVFQVTVLNVSESDVVIRNRTPVGSLFTADDVVCSIDQENSPQLFQHLEGVVIGKNLSDVQQKKVSELIEKYHDVFASNPKKPSRTTSMEHRIDTGDALPVKYKQRRVPVAFEEEVDRQVDEMLRNDIIRPSCSPWNAPLLLVKKKDGSQRFVCDFRGLNDVTKKDNYPLPHIKDVIDKMEGSRYWTTLDAASAYWSMPLSEGDKEKTSFSVPRGKYEFNVTPYGLTNAGASYQRLMDCTLAGLPVTRILAYMDDIVIFNSSFEEHMLDIESVFQRLREANITLKASKCVFAAEKVDFLGYELSSDGIRPQKRLTTAIQEFHRPESRKDVKRFLGLAGFYRSFIKGFGDICHPLNQLTSDNVVFEWSNECESAFTELKRRLCSEPILAFPRVGEEFVVDVDASDHAFGGVLQQRGSDSKFHPVAYFSDAVQASQRNWPPTTKEAFALVLAVRHWHVYLAGRHFRLNSDHNPLVYMRNQKDPRGKFSRWITELEEYDYSIEYIPGIENVKADPLSRNKSAADTQPESELESKIYAVHKAIHTLSKNPDFIVQLREEQNSDPVVSSVKRVVEQGEGVIQGRLKRVRKQLRVVDGLLLKSGRPVLPASLRSFVLTAIHSEYHFGVDKTYALLKERFYWPNMYRTVDTFVASCDTCQRTKPLTVPPKAPLLPMVIPSKPMEFITIDIAHMPKDKDGYRYFLLIGDMFSKYIRAVALRDQEATSISGVLSSSWLFIHGMPSFLLSDQGSNVDGDVMRKLCEEYGIEKRRSSAYHSQGNGLAERNIRNVKEILRCVLHHRKLSPSKWRSLLPEITFALNCSVSSAIKCQPYKVVFGREPVLPVDSSLGLKNASLDIVSPREFSDETNMALQELFDNVKKYLKSSKSVMQAQYNKKLKFHDYQPGVKVWLAKKFFKTGESRKLSPRRSGPWTVVEKLPNGVNFRIACDRSKEEKIVHHDRLYPVKEGTVESRLTTSGSLIPSAMDDSCSAASVDDGSDYELSLSDFSSDGEEPPTGAVDNAPLRYPRRNRVQREIPGAVPWDVVEL